MTTSAKDIASMADKFLVCKVRLELSVWPNYLSPIWQPNQNLNDFLMASTSIMRAFISVSLTIFTKNAHNVASSIWFLKIDPNMIQCNQGKACFTLITLTNC